MWNLQVAVHFVIVLDISGSMSSCDCYSHEGKRQRRIDAAPFHSYANVIKILLEETTSSHTEGVHQANRVWTEAGYGTWKGNQK